MLVLKLCETLRDGFKINETLRDVQNLTHKLILFRGDLTTHSVDGSRVGVWVAGLALW